MVNYLKMMQRSNVVFERNIKSMIQEHVTKTHPQQHKIKKALQRLIYKA